MVDLIDTPGETEGIPEDEQIALVELHSIGGLCEPDLTGSSHILIITKKTGEKIAKIIDAGAFQKKSHEVRNVIFEEIYKKFKVSGIVLTHDHFDHSGRLVALHKAVCGHHKLENLPIYLSRPSRRLLPHVLQSYHGFQTYNTRSFDEVCGRFWQAFNAFGHNYAAKSKKEKHGRKDHRSNGDKLWDNQQVKESQMKGLEAVFLENGGEKIQGQLKIPKDSLTKRLLNDILRAITKLYDDESDKYSSNEKYRIDKTRECLGYLGIGVDANDFFEEVFSEEIPRSNRKGRQQQIDTFKAYIEKKIEAHRKTLLPEITDQDIHHVLQNSHGLEESSLHTVPGLPGVQMSFHPTGHMLGSVAVKFIFTMVGGRVKKLLFSGDIGRFRENSLHGDPEVLDPDVSVSETTYATKRHPEKEAEITKIIDFVQEQSGPILMPVFALDRMYVVLYELQEQIISGQIDCPIFCRNNLGEATADIYREYYPELGPIIDKIKFIGGEEAHKIMRGDKKCIMIASGGTLQDTSSANNLLNSRIESGSKPTVLLTGYQPAGIGRVLMEFCNGTDDPKETITVYLKDGTPCEIQRKDILLTKIFSGHGDHEDILEYASQSEQVKLIHGDLKGAKKIQRELGNAEIVERGKTYTLFDSRAA